LSQAAGSMLFIAFLTASPMIRRHLPNVQGPQLPGCTFLCFPLRPHQNNKMALMEFKGAGCCFEGANRNFPLISAGSGWKNCFSEVTSTLLAQP